MGSFNSVDIAPEELYLYPKSTQTDELIMPKEEPEETPSIKVEDSQEKKQEDEKQQQTLDGYTGPTLIPKEITEKEKAVILGSETFLTFLTKSSQMVERQIAEPDFCKTYIKDDDDKASLVFSFSFMTSLFSVLIRNP